MMMATTYPVLKLKMPADLAGVKNGEIPPKLLRTIKSPKGQLHSLAATAWNAMQLAAYFDGIELKQVGAYRPIAAQIKLFRDRYTLKPTGRTPQVTRTYQGSRWYLKKGMSPAGTPGTSTHGFGLAIDVASASGKRLEWLLGDGFATSNALKYGFSWQVASGPNAEAWHLQYVCAEKLPLTVLDAIAAFPEIDVR
jgi:LAS superfamily LD-carboxypeptidase LdcB